MLTGIPAFYGPTATARRRIPRRSIWRGRSESVTTTSDGDPCRFAVRRLRNDRRQHPAQQGDATDQEVTDAAVAVGAHAFIAALPDGYATDVHQRGTRLSAGQRQLIAFARAFLADPAVVILDEATASLDIPTERTLHQALRTLLAGRTALIIAHRLSSLDITDRVIVVEGGRIVDDGTPAHLLAKGSGAFAALYRDAPSQLR